MSLSHSTYSQKEQAPPVGRRTNCDRCLKPRPDCLWVRPEGTDDEWCLCGGCRERCRRKGVALVNIDADFPELV